MSDRTQGAVQTGTRPGQAPDAPAAGAAEAPATGSVPLAGGPGSGSGPAVVARNGSGRPAGGKGKARGPRRARLQLRHIDTWSALKISLVLSIVLFFVWMIAIAILYGVLSGLGVFDALNNLVGTLENTSGEETVASDAITPGIVFGGAAVIGAINIVLMTALCTVGAFIYNMCSDLVGGLEVTLAERD
ncbi:DUF3566 domain-containing protein [Blastococcus sp. TF02A-26]|uniref:DUF3566 domain-containing protein n=1 Tax=Blastococcus sp. TF02A-26 TaxID=2250577 RepID=UPI000DEA169B|nr:DUF3566 domain-containing protein [Blastococcus sp. TF02A-26]RBY88664.1 DUF3566 domain-containing protein [Blastococcus sp. TF02A-26]